MIPLPFLHLRCCSTTSSTRRIYILTSSTVLIIYRILFLTLCPIYLESLHVAFVGVCVYSTFHVCCLLRRYVGDYLPCYCLMIDLLQFDSSRSFYVGDVTGGDAYVPSHLVVGVIPSLHSFRLRYGAMGPVCYGDLVASPLTLTAIYDSALPVPFTGVVPFIV